MEGTCNKCVFPLEEDECIFYGSGATSLMYAAFEGQIQCVKELIEAGADVNTEDKDGGTALVWAAAGDQFQSGARLNKCNKDGITAALLSNTKHCDIQSQAEVNGAKDAKLPAHIDQTETGTDVNKHVNKKSRDPNDAGADVAEFTYSPNVTLDNQNLNNPEGTGADANRPNADFGNDFPDKFKVHQRGVDVNAPVTKPEMDHAACARFLIAAGADVNTADDGNRATALAKAAYYGNYKCVDFLLQAGADVNATTQDGITVLIASVLNTKKNCEDLIQRAGALYVPEYHRHDRCVELLLNAGADVNAVESYDLTNALMNAVANGYHKSAELLIQAGADVNSTDSVRAPVLIFAAKGLQMECVDLLLNAGADVNQTNTSDYTSLHYFAAGGSIEDVKKLLLSGAHVNKNNFEGNNALEHAIVCCDHDKRSDVLLLLLAAGEAPAKNYVRRFGSSAQIPVPEYLLHQDIKMELKHMCREAIRKHLTELDPHAHLFGRIPRLEGEIPSSIVRYLLYNTSLENESNDEENEQCKHV